MSSEMIRSALAERAEDVAVGRPDLDGLHARVAATRRRRRRVQAVGVSAVLAVVVAVGSVLGGDEDTRTPDPAPSPPSVPTHPVGPSPSRGSSLPHRAEPVEVLPTPYDRETAERARVLATVRNEPGDPTLEWTVGRTADLTYVQQSCRDATDTWLVVVGAGGSSSAAPCGNSGGFRGTAMPTMPFFVDTGFLLPDLGEPLKAFITTVDPAEVNGTRGMRRGIPTRTSATFELAVWGQDFSAVAALLGHEVSALGEASGRDWWFTHGVEAATGADSLTLELPASQVDRVVQTVTDYSRFQWRGEMPFVEISVDGRTVDHRFDRPRILFQDETSAFVPAGGPHTVVLRVTEGRLEDVDFAAAVFEAGDRR